MPLFEYRCSTCGHLEEVLQKHGDPAPDPCPACGKAAAMAKEVSLTSFQLKGGGWYKDLYASTPKEGGKKDSTGGGATPSEGGGSAAAPSTPSATPPASPSSGTTTSTAPAKSSTPATGG